MNIQSILFNSENKVSDNYGNALSGISDSNFNFTTMAAPQTYSLLITEVNSNATGNDFFEIFNYGNRYKS